MAKNDCSKCPYKLAAKFVKPTVEQCAEYAKEIGYTTFDAEGFFWKMESLGWTYSDGRPYKLWRGIIQTWFRAAKRRGEIKEVGKTFKERFEENKNVNR